MVDTIVASFAINKLGDSLIQEANFLCGVSGRVEDLKSQLNRMRSFLKEADSKASNADETVHNALLEIRNLAFDAEDVIETYALKVASWRRKGIMNILKRYACILNEVTTLCKVRSKIDTITDTICRLNTNLSPSGIKDLNDGSSSTTHQRPPTYSYIDESYFVGRDKSIKDLLEHLVDNNCRVICIWGMGGLGKTTLAKMFYNHDEVKDRFEHFAWSYVSQKFKAEDVLQEILSELEQRDVTGSRGQLVKKLRQFLQEKRCLVILDDIWDHWVNLRDAFPREQTSSLVLLTTRNELIVPPTDPTCFHCEPPYLNSEESWELLKKIHQKGDADLSIDATMEKLGREMLEYCEGLPLAINMLGGILASKEWRQVHQTINSRLRGGQGHGQQQLGVSDVLALSYDYLPVELKLCFLYLSHFPKHYEIRVDQLIQLWVAEGLISSEHRYNEEGEETLEDVAEDNLNELVSRCMVLVGERDVSSRIKTCRMHERMRDFCKQKAQEDKFFHVVNCQEGDEPSSCEVRRLALHIHQTLSKGHVEPIKIPRLRSVLCSSKFQDTQWSLKIPFFNNLKLLRVLELESSVIYCEFPKDIGKLIHLRYLRLINAFVSLGSTNFYKLPSSLGNLRCLQTLDLRIKEATVWIPNVLWKMKDLRHLYLPKQCDCKRKLQLGNLRRLQTLVNFSFKNFDASELHKNVTNLRDLSIQDIYLVHDFGETFKSIRLKYLRTLSLDNCTEMKGVEPEKIDVGPLVSGCINVYELRLCGRIEKLPDNPQLLKSIADIFLSDTRLEEDPMPTLEKLCNLRRLTLDTNAFTGKQMVCSRKGFPQLNSLSLDWLVKLEEWTVDKEALPNLCHLKISRCEKLNSYPAGLRHILLKELKIINMPPEFEDKVKDVPSVIFQRL